MPKDLTITVLFDFYGDMLTEKQKEVIDLYYNEDLSLAEIASDSGITRQGVRDSIKRAEATLLELEERLGLARRFGQMQQDLGKIAQYAKDIQFESDRMGASSGIYAKAGEIARLALKLSRD
ncbi:MAG: DNA-binding protein [Provencibacterium sp.]|jgi:predicted DNA-binding protein YlxM (UPF0122 family)|nr:DNA-binding protein [Provencibacterium sp.]